MKNKPYHREIPRNWFLKSTFYKLYMLREATAITLLIYTLNLVCGLSALVHSKESWISWVNAQSNPLMILLAIVSLLLALFHSYTWFNATPKVMPLQKGAKKIPAKLIVNANWGAFALISVIALVLAAI